MVHSHKVLKEGEWVLVPLEEWSAFHGHRKMTIDPWKEVEYHGPCQLDGEVSRAVRECRCDSCTLLEAASYEGLSRTLKDAVDAMIRSVEVAQ